MKRDILEEFKTNKKLVSLYTNIENRDAFNVGFILDYDTEFLLLNSISTYGKCDGVLMIYIDEIFRIESDSIYNNKLLKLLNNDKLINYQFGKYNSCIEKMFNYAKDNDMIISLSFFDSDNRNDVIGKVMSFDNEQVKLSCYDEEGRKDGISIIKTSDINFASIDSEDEKMISFLI